MNKKGFKLEINDIFDELSDENKSVVNELKIAKKFIKLLEIERNFLLNCVNKCLNCGQNKDITERIEAFETSFKTKFVNELDLKTKQLKDYSIVTIKPIVKQIASKPKPDLTEKFGLKTDNILKIRQKLRHDLGSITENKTTFETIGKQEIDSNSDTNDNDFDDYQSADSSDESNHQKRSKSKANKKKKKVLDVDESASEIVKQQTEELIENKFIINVKKKRKSGFECDLCDFKTYRSERLETHIYAVHEKTKPFKCRFCGLAFAGRARVNDHMNAIHLEVEQMFCNKCKFRTRDPEYFDAHQKRHQIACDNGKMKTQSQRNKLRFKCHFCGHLGRSIEALRSHINLTHLYRCGVCSKTFDGKSDLRKHSMLFHKHEKPFKCDFKGCSFAAKLSAELKGHVRKHTGEKPLECRVPNCGKKFSTHTNRYRHEKWTHSSLTMPCEWPGCETVVKLQNYKTHLKLHTDPKVIPCPWPGCPERYANSSNLSSHLQRVHSDVKKYICSHCEKGFKGRNDLKKHVMIHTGERPLQCPIQGCERTFIHTGNRKRHLTTHRETPLIYKSKEQMNGETDEMDSNKTLDYF